MREGREWQVVLRNYRKDGTSFWNNLHVSPVRDKEGRLMHYFSVIHDVTEQKAHEEELARRAFRDSLTGLPNRASFEERLASALDHRNRLNALVALLYMDLDNFKFVNDALGHEAGDSLLVEAANRLQRCVGKKGTVARMGGDEFTVLLKDIDGAYEAVRVAGRIVQEFQAPILLPGSTTEVVASASVGIALSSSGMKEPNLLRNADAAMYEAKNKGKGGYQLFEPRMTSEAEKRLSLEIALRRAIERGEFVVYYQPRVSLSTGRIVGVEALLRWEHPERGLLTPDEFIPLAEETGLILPIGDWVLREACEQTKEWQQTIPGTALVTSVNLSAKQFQRPELFNHLAETIRESGVDPKSLAVEVPETALVEDIRSAIPMLMQLKELGVRVEIDDFGTGYSSLSLLKQLPLKAIKVDRTFVEGLGRDPDSSVLASGIASLAHALELEVVAEGVETDEHLGLLKALGYDFGQGTYWSEPRPREAVMELLS